MAEELTGDEGTDGAEAAGGAGASAAGASVAIVPVRERFVDFYGDRIAAAQTADEEIYVPVRPICTYLGLSWAGQRERINRDPVLAEALRSVRVTRTEAGEREVLCLPLEFLPGWLFGINAARVKPELQEKITRYRRECFRVLWRAFQGDVMAAAPAVAVPEVSGAALALEIATAVQHMAAQQLDMEGRLGQVAGRHEVMAEYMRGFIQKTEGRLTSLELQLSGGSTISEAQAGEIALAVKNVGQRLVSGGDKNGYARVYSEMYRRYRISSYKNLPSARYAEVVDWLHGWYEELNAV